MNPEVSPESTPFTAQEWDDLAIFILQRAKTAARYGTAGAARAATTPPPARRTKKKFRTRDPQTLGGVIKQTVDQQGWSQQQAVYRLFDQWSDLVGTSLAEHTKPVAYQEEGPETRVLVVQADATVWASSLRMMLPQLQQRFDSELGAGVVTDIKILNPAAPSWRKGPRHVRGRGPRDTYG